MSGETLFSELLKEYRHASGYSQEALAERAGLSGGAIGALEQGFRRAPRRDTVKALADALDLSEAHRRELEEAAARARGRQTRVDSGIPATLTSFVERDEVGELRALLPEHRLLTITGSGGIGKTRIAIEVARCIEADYDQTWFVDLLPVRDSRLVLPQITARLNVPVEGEDGLSAVVQRLHADHTLLVIDNCEHVIAVAASVLGSLLRRCSRLTVLATSREPLAASGELVYRLPSMSVSNAAVLFVARAVAASHALSIDASHLTVISDICKKLDGIPLAIELAASSVPTLGLEQLQKRLNNGLTLPGNRDVHSRHQTMAATIAWSYDLLNDDERLLLERLSVFFGGFTLNAAEEICSDDLLPATIVADVLSRLVQKSLIEVVQMGASTTYRFLDAIRTFAWDRLRARGELEKSMLSLIRWFTAKAKPLEYELRRELISELRFNLDNVASAVGWAMSAADYEAAVAAAWLLIGCQTVWTGTNRQAELRTLGFGLLEHLRESETPEVVGRVIWAIFHCLSRDERLALSKRAVPLLLAAECGVHAAVLHAHCAYAEWERGDVTAAKKRLAEGSALLTSRDSRRSRTAFTFAVQGAHVHNLLGDFSGARSLLDAFEFPPGDPFEVFAAVVLAESEWGEGRLENAIDILRNAKLGIEPHHIAKNLTMTVSENLARYNLSLGDLRAAEADLREALIAVAEVRPFWAAAAIRSLLKHAAFFAAASGRAELGARLIGAYDQARHQEALEVDAVARARAIDAVAAHLSAQRIRALCRIGANEDVFELIEEYLAQPAPSDTARPS